MPTYDQAKERAIERFQRAYVTELLTLCGGNVSRAAREAGMTRAALHRILRRLNLPGARELALAGFQGNP
ncbi:MAG: hypothetical protein HYY84_12485 [Deltaproteobacteria bacterium]|nr:hypothetical protein [Deltaproteobacteria bacterium]